jgi:prepilin-type N-terminal cleavage/methylation domain-containing protein
MSTATPPVTRRQDPVISPARLASARRGLTLLEVLIVVVILGLAGAMVIPSMGSTGVLRVQGAIRTIVADLTFAQSDAIAFQEQRAIVFDPAANSYRVIQVVNNTVDYANTLYDGTSSGRRYIVDINNPDFGGARILSATFGVTQPGGLPAGTSTFLLDDMGTPITTVGGNTPSTGGRIRIEGQNSVHDILIEPYTGRITVRRVSGE